MSASELDALKIQLRRRFRAQREALDRRGRRDLGAQINQHLLASDALRAADSVAGYLAFNGEPDLRFTLTQIHRRGGNVALPRLREGTAKGLEFHAWSPATPLQVNQFGISEPQKGTTYSPDELNLILIPLVAWSRDGSRLGMGGGYYDRVMTKAPGVLRVGVAWGLQEHNDIPMDRHDQYLDAVVTEERWFTCNSRGRKIP